MNAKSVGPANRTRKTHAKGVQEMPNDSAVEPAAIDTGAHRRRTMRPFPASSFQEALEFAKELFQIGAGQPVRRLTLFDHLGKAPDSGPSRMLITNSNRYGFTRGSYVAEHLELTPDGLKAVDDAIPKREQRRAWATLAHSSRCMTASLTTAFRPGQY
jgi:hypothetical protein